MIYLYIIKIKKKWQKFTLLCKGIKSISYYFRRLEDSSHSEKKKLIEAQKRFMTHLASPI